MIQAFRKMKISHKLLIPNVLYLAFLGIVVFFYFNSSQLIADLSRDQQVMNGLSRAVQHTTFSIKDYIGNALSYEGLMKDYDALTAQLDGHEMSGTFDQIRKELDQIHALRTANVTIENEIEQQTGQSVKQSNGFIEMVSKKLADEQQRSQVSTLERLVIIGANINTTANYELKVLFRDLKADLAAKDKFLKYIETLVKNTENDVQRLANTPYQKMALAAQQANTKIKQLALDYIGNVEQTHTLQQSIYSGIEKGTVDIEKVVDRYNQTFFGKIKMYFTNILITLLVVIFAGGIISLLLSKSISGLLTRTISGLTDAAEQINAAAGQVSQSSQYLAEGSSQQAASVQETSASLEEMSSMTKQNAEHSGQADHLMKKAGQVVQGADRSMDELTGSMAAISKSSEETSKIVKTIDEIAFQTNLLALNAAVEAARAGEAGAGFAVVADEVRNLAMRAADAARNTTALIDDTTQKVTNGADLVKKASNAFGQVSASATKVAELVSEISAASKEQSQGIDQISEAVSQMDKVTQQNAASAEESASASEQMSAQTQQMKQMIDELSALIGGRGRKNRQKDAAPQMKAEKIRTKRSPAPVPATTGEQRQSDRPAAAPALPDREVSPEQLIPLDDADLKDF